MSSKTTWKDSELGRIPGQWEVKRIDDIGEVVGGGTPSTKNQLYYDGDISWITPRDLANHTGRFIFRGERSITEAGLKNSSAKLLPKGTVLFSSRAPIGYVAIAGKELCTNQGFKSIVCNESVDNRFIYYTMKMSKDSLEAIAGGSTFKEVSGSVVRGFKIKVPPLSEQRGIADILTALDEKIELNAAIADNLEDIVQALFKRWFVDFEFPNEDDEPYKSSGGEFKESELGAIPKGWRVGHFQEVIAEMIGGDWGKETPQGNFTREVSCIRGADIPEIAKGSVGKVPQRFILPKNATTKSLKHGDIIIEVSGGSPTQSTGRSVLIINEILNKFSTSVICTNFCKVVKPMVGFNEFLYAYLLYLYNEGSFFQYENGTTGIKNLDIRSLFQVHHIVIPTMPILERFSVQFQAIYRTIQHLGRESIKLGKIRDTLLPKLMSGEIRVPVEQEQVQEQTQEQKRSIYQPSYTDLPMAAENKADYQT